MSLDQVQFGGAFLALLLQVIATVMVQPLRRFTPSKPWRLLMGLNICVMARRAMSVFEIGYSWNGQVYESFAVVIGLSVSVFMLLSVVGLRQHMALEKQKAVDVAKEAVELAKATMLLAKEKQAEDSLAYQLALHFIELREERESLRNGESH